MSRWSHRICDHCWGWIREPWRTPVRVKDDPEGPCCWCRKPTKSGIWLRHDPSELVCEHSEVA